MPGPSSSSTPPPARDVRSLSGLLPFLRPYRGRIVLAVLFLVLAAASTLVFPVALRGLIDEGFIRSDPGTRVMALREHFVALFGVGVALGVFSALRFYMVSWLGERVTADLRSAVYSHVVRQSPEFFETTQTGEVLSRLTTDTTLVQTVVGSSLSMGLRNTVMGLGALAMLIVTNPYVMTQVLGILVLVVLPSLYFGRRVRKLSRASQDRVADSSAIAAEVLNAIPVVQGFVQEGNEAARFEHATEEAFDTARKRTRVRSALVAFIITIAPSDVTMLRSAKDADEPMTVCTSVVSVVRRDSTSPVCVVSKNSGLWRSTCANTAWRRSAVTRSPIQVTM